MVQNALTLYDKIQDASAFLETAGRDIAASKIFGDLTVSQGKIFAWECSVRRTPPLSLAIDYHLMFNRLTMKAEAMLSKFHEKGGISEEISRTPDRAEIKLTSNGHTSTYSLTWEDAQGESFPYETKGTTEDKIIDAITAWKAGTRGAKQPALKTKYKTPRSRMQMLWARLVSDAIRAKMPEVNSGRYTPEEFDDGDDDEPQAGGDGQNVIDVPFEVKPEAKATETKPANGQHAEKPTDSLAGAVPAMQGTIADDPTSDKGNACLATPAQVSSICAAMNTLGMTSEQRGKALAKRGVVEVPALSFSQATELLGTLNAKVDANRKAALDAANGRTTDKPLLQETVAQAVVNRDVSGPATDVQVAAAKDLLTEMEQTSPGATARFVKSFKESGREKLADMTGQEIDALIEQLKTKNLEKFFAESLKPKN